MSGVTGVAEVPGVPEASADKAGDSAGAAPKDIDAGDGSPGRVGKLSCAKAIAAKATMTQA